MKQAIWTIGILICCVAGVSAQTGKLWLEAGNRAYNSEQYELADSLYQMAADDEATKAYARYNQGNVQFKKQDFENAARTFEMVAGSTTTPDSIRSKSYHNLGNSHLNLQQFDKAVDAYKQALRIDPSDHETRYNLAYAMKMLQQQQEQQQNQDQNQDQDQQQIEDQQNEQNQQNQDQQKDSEDQQKQDESSQEEQQKGDQDQQQQQNQGDKQEEGQEQEGQNAKKGEEEGEPAMSREDAERILEYLQQDENKTLQSIRKEKHKGQRIVIEKDW